MTSQSPVHHIYISLGLAENVLHKLHMPSNCGNAVTEGHMSRYRKMKPIIRTEIHP